MTFGQLFKDSYVLRFTVALILTITVCVLWLQGREVPQILYTAWIAALGYGLGILNEKAMKTTPPDDQEKESLG